MTQFNDFGLPAPITAAIAAAGYTNPTPIQTKAIRPILEGRDVLGIAQTGTGKTLAFAAPTLARLAKESKPLAPRCARVLVLAPTRELAGQIAESFEIYGAGQRLKIDCIYGGVKIPRQIKALSRGTDILVATPGRLIDLQEQRAVDLSQVETLILDEADQMLDLGFIHALKKIAQLVPGDRQTLFFSATMPDSIASLSKQFLTNPVKVSVTPSASTAERVEQSVIHIAQKAKPALLCHLLKSPDVRRVLVFTRTKHGADRLVRQLGQADIEAVAIHGNKSQNQRLKALDAFKSGKAWVLVATDIAARGLDIDGLTHVINFEIPNVPEQYVHRIGRTGRAGASGVTIGLVAPDEREYLRDIEKTTRQAIPVLPLPAGFTLPTLAERTESDANERREARSEAGSRQRNGQGRGARPQASGTRSEAGRSSSRPAQGTSKPRADGNAPRREGGDRPARAPAKAAGPSGGNGQGGNRRRRQRSRRPAGATAA